MSGIEFLVLVFLLLMKLLFELSVEFVTNSALGNIYRLESIELIQFFPLTSDFDSFALFKQSSLITSVSD